MKTRNAGQVCVSPSRVFVQAGVYERFVARFVEAIGAVQGSGPRSPLEGQTVTVEGVVVGHHSVIGMGVFLGQSTRIYNRMTGEVSYGYVPPYSVVVSGQLPAKDGSHSLYCAVIVKQVDEKTRSKTSVNELLRGLAD